jgi:hypothetical protein
VPRENLGPLWSCRVRRGRILVHCGFAECAAEGFWPIADLQGAPRQNFGPFRTCRVRRGRILVHCGLAGCVAEKFFFHCGFPTSTTAVAFSTRLRFGCAARLHGHLVETLPRTYAGGNCAATGFTAHDVPSDTGGFPFSVSSMSRPRMRQTCRRSVAFDRRGLPHDRDPLTQHFFSEVSPCGGNTA